MDTPLWLHCALLAGVLLVVLPFTSPNEIWVSDEGAIRLQAEILADDGTWMLERPVSEIDPEGLAVPIAAATVVGGDYAPFATHPAVSLGVASAVAIGGQASALAVSILSTIVAAILTALIAAPLGRGVSVMSLWTMGLASPMFVYSFTVLGHTTGTAIAALLILCLIRFLEGRSLWAMGVLACGFAGPFFRTEAALLGLAVAGVVLVASFTRGRRGGASLAVGLALATAAGYWGNAIWQGYVVASNRIDLSTAGATSSSWLEMLSALGNSLLRPGFGTFGSMTAVLALLAGVIALGLAIRSPNSLDGSVVLASCFVFVSGSTVILAGTEAVSGLLAAFPLVVFGVVSLRSSELRTHPGGLLGWVVLSYAALVIVAQEPGGGGGQWGGRYFMLSMPALVPLAVAAAARALSSIDRRARVIAVVALLAATLAMGVTAVRALHNGGARSSLLAHRIEEIALLAGDAGDARGPLILSTRTQIGRVGWREVQSLRYFLVEEDALDTYIGRLRANGIERVLLFSTSDEEIEIARRWGFRIESEPSDPWGPARFLILSVDR